MTTVPTTRTRVAIVGAGFGGLAMVIELQRAGISDYVVLERADHVGGVWQANSYPGAACDVPSVIYQFSYALKVDWSKRFGSQAEIRQYLHDVADEQGVLPHVRYRREVTEAAFDEDAGRWRVSTTTGEVYDAQVLLCATGQLSRPRILDLPGREAFERAGGIDFHSAEWDHDADLTGKRVVVVGGGASAIQVVPAIAEHKGPVYMRLLRGKVRMPGWLAWVVTFHVVVLAWIPFRAPDLDLAANFYYMLFGKEPSPATRKVLDACLVLHAEHTMNASTFAGMVTASTLADPYTVVASSIGALKGPLHGGANEEVVMMLREIGTPAQARCSTRSRARCPARSSTRCPASPCWSTTTPTWAPSPSTGGAPAAASTTRSSSRWPPASAR